VPSIRFRRSSCACRPAITPVPSLRSAPTLLNATTYRTPLSRMAFAMASPWRSLQIFIVAQLQAFRLPFTGVRRF